MDAHCLQLIKDRSVSGTIQPKLLELPLKAILCHLDGPSIAATALVGLKELEIEPTPARSISVVPEEIRLQ